MSRLQKLVAFYLSAAFVVANSVSIYQRVFVPQAIEVEWFKLLLATLVQVSVVVLFACAVPWVLGRPRPDPITRIILGPLGLGVVVVIVGLLLGIFGTGLMRNALICGDQPYPPGKNRPVCTFSPSATVR